MFEPTPEQAEIVNAARKTRDNLIINALAGSAKTTTLELIAKAITGIPILSLQFNKRTADESRKRLPTHVEARTMNSLGHMVWSKVTGKRLRVDPAKSRDTLRNLIKELPKRQQGEAWDAFSEILQWVRRAKRDGYVPPSYRGVAKFHCGEGAEWVSRYDEDDLSQLHQHLIATCVHQSITDAYDGLIDYDDQIYMPVCFGAPWPRYPLVLVDEMQDLNELQHEMIAALAGQRLIGVGDPWQSIYAFRGAKSNGMAAAQLRWNMTPLTLSTTFRVPQAGVRRAWLRVPHMRWYDGAPEGEVLALKEWKADEVPDNAAILCRNNAPLFSLALRFLRRGRGVKLVGMDIGPGLIKIMKGLGPPDMLEIDVGQAIDNWAKAQIQKGRKEENVYDKAECLHALVGDRTTFGDAISWAEHLFKQDGLIQLMSIHKAKGLEWDTVYHLDPWRIPSKFAKEGTEEWEQELNAKYVCETRFKKSLRLVTMEGLL